jgi:CDP-ribitol ribitolphosphotransferase
MYAPTFRGINARYAYFPMDMIDFDGFGEYLEKHNSVMLIKMHPFVREPLPIPEKYKDRIIDASSYREINNRSRRNIWKKNYEIDIFIYNSKNVRTN